MDARALPDLVSNLVASGDLRGAERALLEARTQAEAEKDAKALEYVLPELIELYGMFEPPLWAKAEELSQERERLIPSAYRKLQTAMIFQHGVQDYRRAIPKLEEAIQQGRDQLDDKTVYTALCLLGEAHLKLGYTDRAAKVLKQVEEIVASKKSFVAGDETCFLEALRAQRLESERVSRLASTLASVCRDPAFKDRLKALATGA